MDVFLFPLVNMTLFPGTTKPLHIFEPRYLEMINESIEKNMPIALGFVEDPLLIVPAYPGEKIPYVKEVAGFGYAQIVEKRQHGNLLVFIHGEGKVKLKEVKSSSTPYLICASEIIADRNQVDDTNLGSLQALESILHRWVKKHIPDLNQQKIFIQNMTGHQEIVGAFAAYLVEDYELQQLVLEMNDINDKIHFLIRLVSSNRILN